MHMDLRTGGLQMVKYIYKTARTFKQTGWQHLCTCKLFTTTHVLNLH